MSGRSKKIVIVVCVVLLIVIAGGLLYYSKVKEYHARVDALELTGVDLAQIPDGVYMGSSDAVLVSAEVEVTVEDHRIVEIKLQHNHGRGEAAEVITDRVIGAQSLDVELISGATSSSKVILDAIQNALN